MVGFFKISFMTYDKDIVDYTYLNGKIYLVKCKYNKDLIYIGSTKKTLGERLNGHRNSTKKNSTSLHNVVQGDWDNWYIELYENYPCYNKYQLRRREGEVIRLIATINKCVAGRTKTEYRQDNRDRILEREKQYRQDNRDRILEQKKNYANDNRDKILEKDRKYYQNNRDKILQKQKENIICNVCGCEVRKHGLKEHQRTKKCSSYKTST